MLFNLLLQIGPLKANVIATVVATTSSYFMNRHWTYRNLPQSSLRREYVLFFALNIVGLLIESVFLFGARYGLHFNEHTDIIAFNIAKFAGLGLGTVFRFWSYRRFVFGAQKQVHLRRRPAQASVAETGTNETGRTTATSQGRPPRSDRVRTGARRR